MKTIDADYQNIEKLEKVTLVDLLSFKIAFGKSTHQLKDETVEMLFGYLRSLESELSEEQKAHIFHFYRMYDFYKELEKKIIDKKQEKAQLKKTAA